MAGKVNDNYIWQQSPFETLGRLKLQLFDVILNTYVFDRLTLVVQKPTTNFNSATTFLATCIQYII